MFKFQDLISELSPKYYSVLTLQQVFDLIEHVNSTLQVLYREGYSFDYDEVVKEAMGAFLNGEGLPIE